MTTTALDLHKRGVRFERDNVTGRLRLKGPKYVLDAAREEIERRASLFAALPPRAPFTPRRITPAPSPQGRAAYYGRCEHCDDPMPKHRGGTCPLCEAAGRWLAREQP